MDDTTGMESIELARASRLADGSLGRATIVAGYLALFWGVLPLLLWTLGVRFDAWLGLLPVPGAARALGALLGALSAGPLVRAMWLLLRRGRGLPISHLPPTRLVESGLYAHVRHPIYLSFSAAWIGLALGLGSWGAAIAGGVVLTVAWIGYALAVEEPRLLLRFGAAYLDYAARTRLFPCPAPLRRLLSALWRAFRPAAQRLANRTVLLRGRRWSLVSYGAFVALGAALMSLWSSTTLIAVGVDKGRCLWFSLGACAAMLAGGRVVGLLYRPLQLRASPGRALRTVGFVSWGGYFALVGAAALAAPALELSWGALLDRLILPGLAASAIGRLGCLSYGCCGGRPWPHGIVWSNPDARVVRELGRAACVPRIPTQLLSSGWALCVIALLLWPSTRALPAGALAATGCLLYALGRVALEQTRDEEVLGRLRFTRGQLASPVVAAVSLAVLLRIDGPSAPAVHGAHVGALTEAWPAALACAALCLLVAGLHGRRVGHW